MLAAGSNVDALLALCRAHRPRHAVIADDAGFAALRDGLRDAGLSTQAHAGDDALEALVASDACDTVVAAIVGAAGLPSTLAAARAGKRLLLANKESLVLAGELLMRPRTTRAPSSCRSTASTTRSSSACPDAHAHAGLKRILLTASGGPFRGRRREELTAGHAGAGRRPSRNGRWGRRSRSIRPR